MSRTWNQRICVCLGQITIFRNFMNEDSQKKRQWPFLNNTFIDTCLYSFLKTKRVQFFLPGKLRASDFARCVSYFEEHFLMQTVHIFQNSYETINTKNPSIKKLFLYKFTIKRHLLYHRLVEVQEHLPESLQLERSLVMGDCPSLWQNGSSSLKHVLVALKALNSIT